jgi:hypothetical protein
MKIGTKNYMQNLVFVRTQRVNVHAKRVFICALRAQKKIRPPPLTKFRHIFVPNTQLSKKKKERGGVQNECSTTFLPSSKYIFGTFHRTSKEL